MMILPKRFFFFSIKMFYIGTLFIFGVSVKVKGKPKNKNVVYFSNHTSYMDIFILGSKVNGLFVAKAEINNWPIINMICRLGKTIFINRSKISQAHNQLKVILDHLNLGYNICIFPEGTSNDGTKILPFKSSLFEIINKGNRNKFMIQPVSISYLLLDDIPINKSLRTFISWYGAMELLPHVWKFIGLGKSEIQLNFHEAKYFNEFDDRKQACKYCYQKITNQSQENFNYKETNNKFKNFYGFKSL